MSEELLLLNDQDKADKVLITHSAVQALITKTWAEPDRNFSASSVLQKFIQPALGKAHL